MSLRAIIVLFCACLAAFVGRDLAAQDFPSDDSTTAAVQPPYQVVAGGTTTIVLGAQYEAGSLQRWLFGNYYRDVWTTPLEVPILDLEKTAGGLTPLERGGGNQTTTLHLVGGDGRFYELRSIHKDAERSLSPRRRGTIIASIVQDQNSSLNPVGALIVPPLARAAGILHPQPTLVVIPDSPLLGPFREEFAGMPAMFERDPDEDQSDAPQFGFSRNVVGTTKLLEELREDSDHQADVRAYVRARLFDMVIGDWDRHEDQWRWAEFETERGTRYVPVATDRDFAFVKFDGLLNQVLRLSGKMMFRRLVDFDEDVPDVLGLNWQGLQLDRRMTGSVSRADWRGIADSLALALSDDVIDRAVRSWPDPVFDLIGPMTAGHLKSRRDRLPSIATTYYELLADTVAMYGSDAEERFEITRLSADETRVAVVKISPDGSVQRELSSRVILHDETDEVRLHGHGGEDQIIEYGKAADELLVRITEVDGNAVVIDSSAFEGPARLNGVIP